MSKKPIKLIQITDCHLFENADGKLLGMNTQESLDAVYDRVHAEHSEFDFYYCSGDLAQDGSVAAYQRLKDKLSDKPQYWIPGNHDHRESMLKVVSADKEMVSVLKIGCWQLILLDSQVPGAVHGKFAESQLAILEQALLAEPKLNTLVSMHHHPLASNCQWLDTQKIKNSTAFLNIINEHNNVKAVLWGHVHQEKDTVIDGVRYLSSPSSCVQFTPHSDDFSVDTLGPGYRWIELNDDGTLSTGVSRVDNIIFEIDYSVKGY